MTSFERKKCKNKKKAHTFKGYASSSNVEVLNCFNPELQFKDTKSAIKNKFKKNYLLSQEDSRGLNQFILQLYQTYRTL